MISKESFSTQRVAASAVRFRDECVVRAPDESPWGFRNLCSETKGMDVENGQVTARRDLHRHVIGDFRTDPAVELVSSEVGRAGLL